MTNLINLKAEREIIAWAFNGYVSDVISRVKSNDFADDNNLAVFNAIRACVESDREISPVSVGTMLKRRGDFETVGGMTGLERLADARTYNFDAAMDAIMDASRKRRMRESAERLIELIDGNTKSADQLTNVLFDAAMDVTGGEGEESLIMSKVGDEWWDELQLIQQGVPMGYSCGIPSIDEAVGGIRPGELIGITGAPGRGKSLWALKIIIENALRATDPIATVIYSLEMGRKQLYNRAAVMVSDLLNLRQLRGGPGIPINTKEQMTEAAKIKQRFDKAPLYIGDRFDSIDKVLADARKRARRDNVRVIVIDYAQLLLEGTGMNEASELAKISRKCRVFSQKENVAIILLLKMKQSSSTDALKGNTPTGDMVYGSGAFYYDCNVLLWIHVDDPSFICACEKQSVLDKKTKEIKPRHVKEEEGTPCLECGEQVYKAEFRLGRINALKVRDGDAGAEAQIVMRGARMRLEETGRVAPAIMEGPTTGSRRFREDLLEPDQLESAA